MKIEYNYCIVGYGNHASSKILPSLLKLNNKKIYIVSKKNIAYHKRIERFDNIEKAFNQISKNTIFIVSTPSNTHYLIAKKILKNNFNVLIEKPIFIYSYQYKKLVKLKKNNFFRECFMYKYNLIYLKFKKIYYENQKKINQININFLIPPLKYKSFRDSDNNYPIIIYDIGCYVVSLINELKINLIRYKIINVKNKNLKNKENIQILFITKNFNIIASIGFNKLYQNNISLNLNKNKQIIFDRVFYGKKINKEIIYISNNSKKIQVVKDINSFKNMFISQSNYNRKRLLKDNDILFKNIILLENLSKQYKSF